MKQCSTWHNLWMQVHAQHKPCLLRENLGSLFTE